MGISATVPPVQPRRWSDRGHSFLEYVRTHGIRRGARFAWWKARAGLAANDRTWKLFFEMNPVVRTGEVADYSRYAEQVWNAMKSVPGLATFEYTVDAAKYREYEKRAHYEDYDPYYRGGPSGNPEHRAEKILQHFLSLELLQIRDDDVYIDIASNTSPMRHIVKKLYHVPSYSLDLSYPPGIHGELIGADAGAIPAPDGFASKMSLHCSFEHFAYGSDMRFVRECRRILRPGGKVCIVPLYLLPRYSIRLDPKLEIDLTIRDTEGADKVYVRDYNVDYGRFYNPESFRSRIAENAADLALTLYRIRGLAALREPNVYSEFALIIERK